MRVENALISVTDKRQLDILAKGWVSLERYHTDFLNGGGTYADLKEILGAEAARRHLVQVSDYTGQPETQGGLVKTLDFKIYLGLLTETYNPSHQQDLKRTNAVPIDLVASTSTRFEQTIAKPGVTVEEARANIDIGGPCTVARRGQKLLAGGSGGGSERLRCVIRKMRINGGRLDVATRFELARKAFAHTGNYDRAITRYLSDVTTESVERCYQLKESSA